MSEPDPSILRYYVGIVWRWKWLVIAPLVILPAVAYALAVSQAPVWGTSAAVLLNHQDQIASTLAGVETPPDDAGRYAVTQGLVARSPVLLDRVVDAAGVPHMSARTLVQHSDVQPNADVLQFYVTNRDPEAATRLVNAYARGYTSYRRELDTRNLDSTVRALGARLRQLERAGKASSATYTRLASQQEQVRLIGSLRRSNVYVIRTSGPGDAEQVAPRPLKSTVVWFGGALVLGLLLVALANAFDRRVFDPREVAAAVGAPLLTRTDSGRGPLSADEGLHFAALVHQAARAAGARSILVAGAEAGAAPYTGALAEGMAQLTEDVVLVDADLRQRAVTRAYGLEGRSGLAERLRGDDAAIDPLDIPAGSGSGRLRVLGAGAIAADSAALREATVASTLQGFGSADVVLVAGPPLGSAAESFALAESVDSILLLIPAGVDRRALAETRRTLDLISTPVLGFVLVRPESRISSRWRSAPRARRGELSAEPDVHAGPRRSEVVS